MREKKAERPTPGGLRLEQFDYELPQHLIAQEPATARDQSRLLVVRRAEQALGHHRFADLPDLLTPGDLLVLNDTRVLHARLLGRRARTGGKWEGLFLREQGDGSWEMLCQTGGRPAGGETIEVEPGPLKLLLIERLPGGRWLVRPEPAGRALELLGRHGAVPLPPYIRKGHAVPADQERYQTVYARRPGAVAAPTAGLHFTPAVFEGLKKRGAEWCFVTLHVGLGTFQPIQTDNIAGHRMHREWGELSAETAAAIRSCKAQGGHVVAVGTTTVRVLETAARASGTVEAWSGETDLFIYPPYAFRVVDALVTNFHLPRTSLLLLVGAFAGVDLLREAYAAAVAREYRFYSYGDAMLIL
jgi:S-adenosylmethionine:tRNA ribosyltransferase-isomerase